MPIRQGDVYMVEDEEPDGSEPGYTRPYVVIQNDFYNDTRLQTVLACALSSTVRRADSPENVLLNVGEANLPKASVLLVSQTVAIDKSHLNDRIGTVSAARVNQILNSLRLLTTPRTADEKPE